MTITNALLNLMRDGSDCPPFRDWGAPWDVAAEPRGPERISTRNSTRKPLKDAPRPISSDFDIRLPPFSASGPSSSQREPTPASTPSNPNRKLRKRLGLPITITHQHQSVTVMACPDTGSDESIVPLDLANRLGLQIDRDLLDDGERAFALANGKVVKSLGVASILCSFGASDGVNKSDPAAAAAAATNLSLMVHVFESLAVPAILGAAFLEKTETFTKHRDRLVEELVPAFQSLRVCSVGKPKRGLVCRLDTFVGCANADTGSDLDLVSPAFVHQRGFRVRQEGRELLQFADGSTGLTSGSIGVHFAIGNLHGERGFVPRGNTLDLNFFILDNLTSDILVGQNTLEELNAIGKNGDLFIDSLPQPGLSDCNIIRHIGTVERAVRAALKGLSNSTFGSKDSQNSPGTSSILLWQRHWYLHFANVASRSPQSQNTHAPRITSPRCSLRTHASK